MGCRGRPRRRRARGRRAGGQGTAAPLVDWAASDSEVSSDHDGRDGAGDARRAGSSDGVTPHRQIAQTARPGTDAERIRTPDGTDAGHRYTWGADIPAPEARLHGRGVTHGSRRSLLESRELNTQCPSTPPPARPRRPAGLPRRSPPRPRSRTGGRADRSPPVPSPAPGPPARPRRAPPTSVGASGAPRVTSTVPRTGATTAVTAASSVARTVRPLTVVMTVAATVVATSVVTTVVTVVSSAVRTV